MVAAAEGVGARVGFARVESEHSAWRNATICVIRLTNQHLPRGGAQCSNVVLADMTQIAEECSCQQQRPTFAAHT